ncbi:MAG: antibiotic biosynthesis monooxygenase [Alphaproteobacteria bacterium]|nr:antibiotic biosynthesis monooxygenase [Alphaproteobacteria bacterium]
MIVIAGTVRVPPEKIDGARPHMEKMLNASRAEAGCISYSYAQDVLDPGLIHIAEVWENDAALKMHFDMPHMKEWRAAWPSIGISDRNLTRYVVTDSTPI